VNQGSSPGGCEIFLGFLRQLDRLWGPPGLVLETLSQELKRQGDGGGVTEHSHLLLRIRMRGHMLLPPILSTATHTHTQADKKTNISRSQLRRTEQAKLGLSLGDGNNVPAALTDRAVVFSSSRNLAPGWTFLPTSDVVGCLDLRTYRLTVLKGDGTFPIPATGVGWHALPIFCPPAFRSLKNDFRNNITAESVPHTKHTSLLKTYARV
jgi:hypothetical protein